MMAKSSNLNQNQHTLPDGFGINNLGFARIIILFIGLAIVAIGISAFIFKDTLIKTSIKSKSKIDIEPNIKLNERFKVEDIELPKLSKAKVLYAPNGNKKTVLEISYSENELNPTSNFQILAETSDKIIFSIGKTLYAYQVQTSKLSPIKMPTDNLKSISGSKINNNTLIVNVESNVQDNKSYLLTLDNGNFKELTDLETNCGFMCGGPRFRALISEDEAVVSRSSGDSCWSLTYLYNLNIKTLKVSKHSEFESGCSGLNTKDELIGYFGKNIVTSQTTREDNSNVSTYQTLNLVDLGNQNKKILLNNDSMPKEIHTIIMRDKKLLLFDTSSFSYSEKYYDGYVYSLESNTLSPKTKLEWQSESTETILKVETSTIEPGKLNKAFIDIFPSKNTGLDSKTVFVENENGQKIPLVDFLELTKMVTNQKSLDSDTQPNLWCLQFLKSDMNSASISGDEITVLINYSSIPNIPGSLPADCSMFIGLSEYRQSITFKIK